MARQLKIQPRNDEERRVIGSWRSSKISNNAIVIYLSWVRRFRSYCDHYGLDESKQLTLKGVTKFCSKYVGPRIGNSLSESSRNIARTSLHTWARTLQMLGDDLPRWDKQPKKKKHSLLVEEFLEYRRHHSGVSEATLKRDADIAQKFLAHLRIHGKCVRTASAVDTDTFLATLMKCNSKRTVANLFSALRGFLRYLHMNNRLRMNLADLLAVPRVRRMEHPPRALPWSDVRRLLRAIDRDCPIGKRDYAMLLLMATYGLGAAEVLGLCIGDLDWEAEILTVRRPKTGMCLTLPLLPAAAEATADYLKAGRPHRVGARQIFLCRGVPHRSLTSGGIRHRIRLYARRVGIEAEVLGAHILRHSHATRQVDQGANTKVVSDILGHRSPSSTSAYVRVASRRLRAVSLPVPR